MNLLLSGENMKKKILNLFLICMLLGQIFNLNIVYADELSIIDKVKDENDVWQNHNYKDIEDISSKLDKKISGISLALSNDFVGDIFYRVNSYDDKWDEWKTNGEIIDFKEKKESTNEYIFSALEIKLSEELFQEYELKYRVFTSDNKWSEWVGSGHIVGNLKGSYEILDYQIELSKLDLKDKLNFSNEEEIANETVVSSNQKAINIESASVPTLEYLSHIQNVGWENKRTGISFVFGTTGKNLGLEAIKLNLINVSGGITYKAHVSNIGWQNSVSNGNVSGTTGCNLRMEAVCFSLTGDIANSYDIYYRTHVQNIGWIPWASNGEISGSTGKSLNLEAIEIKLIKKGEVAPVKEGEAYIYDTKYSFVAHVQNVGWQSSKGNNSFIGTTGKSLSLEALQLNIENPEVSGKIQYRSHIQNIGWQNWVSDGQTSGTTGKKLNIEGIQIQLTDGLANKFDIYYRTHVANIGWLGWTKNGDYAGTEGYNLGVEAIEIKVVKKGTGIVDTSGQAFKKVSKNPPQINDIQITHQDSTGYTITCKISSENEIKRVMFPTWTSSNGQDDLLWGEGTISGNTVSYRVKASDHNFESGEYITHIYAYDSRELTSFAVAPAVVMQVHTFNKGQYNDLQKGVDISEWQAGLNLNTISHQIDYVILRIGYTGSVSNVCTKDSYFDNFYNQAIINNIPIGIYYYSTATNVSDAVKEAQFVIKNLKDKKITYPVYFDFEDGKQANLSGTEKESICNAFCLTIKNGGYKAGVYSRQNFLFDYTTEKFDDTWDLWVSHYGQNIGQPSQNVYTYEPYFEMWQYTSKGKLEGYSGNLDLNISYKKY